MTLRHIITSLVSLILVIACSDNSQEAGNNQLAPPQDLPQAIETETTEPVETVESPATAIPVEPEAPVESEEPIESAESIETVEPDELAEPAEEAEELVATDPVEKPEQAEPVEEIDIAPGLTMKVLRAGQGQTAMSGETVLVHYTGWLSDPAAGNGRGEKFDSSVDRDEEFGFPLGAGRVIKGWDLGVEGMSIGEVRELKIASDLAYGDRGAGAVIPPGATLIFEIELVGISDDPQ